MQVAWKGKLRRMVVCWVPTPAAAGHIQTFLQPSFISWIHFLSFLQNVMTMCVLRFAKFTCWFGVRPCVHGCARSVISNQRWVALGHVLYAHKTRLSAQNTRSNTEIMHREKEMTRIKYAINFRSHVQ